MLWVERANPLTQNPDTNSVRKAFENLEFKVVVEQFMTDTANMADIILPAKNMFEQSDLIGSYWSPYVQLRQKILEPSGEVKPESEIWYLLAQKIGISQETILQNLPVPGDAGTEAFLNDKLRPFPELGWEALKQGPLLPASNQEIAFENMVFRTPSGKIELFTPEARQRWNANELADFKELTEIEETDTDDYPLLLITPCTKNRIHSQFGNLAWMKALEPEPLVHIHPVNAQVRKIKDGDMAELFNQRGSIRVKACITAGIKKGCISLTNGWWAASGGNANFLSKGRETDMGFGTAFHDTMVEIKKADWEF